MHKAGTPHKVVSSSIFFLRPCWHRAMLCCLAVSFTILANLTIFLPMVFFSFYFLYLCLVCGN
ncbi:hypothetical protein LINPERPRIM_LOCUS42778 [Linum perenne]